MRFSLMCATGRPDRRNASGAPGKSSRSSNAACTALRKRLIGRASVEQAAKRRYHLTASDVTGTYERVMRENGELPEEYLIGFVHIAGIGGLATKRSVLPVLRACMDICSIKMRAPMEPSTRA